MGACVGGTYGGDVSGAWGVRYIHTWPCPIDWAAAGLGLCGCGWVGTGVGGRWARHKTRPLLPSPAARRAPSHMSINAPQRPPPQTEQKAGAVRHACAIWSFNQPIHPSPYIQSPSHTYTGIATTQEEANAANAANRTKQKRHPHKQTKQNTERMIHRFRPSRLATRSPISF